MRNLAIAFLLAFTGTAYAAPAFAAFPDEKIAFTSHRDGNYEIYVMNADGSDQTRLTTSPANDVDPAFSPDGTKVAFESDRDGFSEIYVMNADGSGQTNVTNDPAIEGDPVFSPDGTKIAFVSSLRDHAVEIYVVNVDGTGLSRLTTDAAADHGPVFSPDGTKIAFSSIRDEHHNEIYVMNVDGTNVTRLTSNLAVDAHPAFSPDGTKIAFISNRDGDDFDFGYHEIYAMNADGTGQTRLTNNPTAVDVAPVFSPGGTRIAFASASLAIPTDDIYVMNADGTGQTRLTTDPAMDSQPDWGPKLQPPGSTFAATVQAPIDADGTSTFNAKRGVVPLKFTLTENGIATCDLPSATLRLTRTGATSSGPIDESVYTSAADSGTAFRITDCQYHYNLHVRPLGPGSYLAEILTNGAVVGDARFELK